MIDLKKVIDPKALQKIQNQFSDATGLAAIAVDAEGSYITEGSNFTDFCMKHTRGCEEGRRRCVKCDTECSGTYFCHAGLMDFSEDIMINGEKAGAIIGGQVLPNPPELEKFRIIARELGINENAYIDALKKVPVLSERTIRAAAQLLGEVVNQLVNLEYLKRISQKKIDIFDVEAGNLNNYLEEIKLNTKELQRTASLESILSINASIEAARAGEAGVGFAVVAKEFGEISKGSSTVYEQIQTSVNKLEQSVKSLIEVGL